MDPNPGRSAIFGPPYLHGVSRRRRRAARSPPTPSGGASRCWRSGLQRNCRRRWSAEDGPVVADQPRDSGLRGEADRVEIARRVGRSVLPLAIARAKRRQMPSSPTASMSGDPLVRLMPATRHAAQVFAGPRGLAAAAPSPVAHDGPVVPNRHVCSHGCIVPLQMADAGRRHAKIVSPKRAANRIPHSSTPGAKQHLGVQEEKDERYERLSAASEQTRVPPRLPSLDEHDPRGARSPRAAATSRRH